MEKINVIVYNSTLLKGGTESYFVGLIKNLDKSKFHVDVLIKNGDEIDADLYVQLKNYGCNTFLAKGSLLKRLLFIRKFFKTNKNKYQVCHINATSQGNGLISYFAKKNGNVPKVIFHSHMGGNDNNQDIIDKIGTKLMFKYSDKFVACSTMAGEFMFGLNFCKNNPVQVLNNAIDTSKFDFNKNIRNQIREELGINKNTFAIVHVGRFAPQKNHKKIIEIFAEYKKINKDSKLLLIGDGELLPETKEQVDLLNLQKDVLFLGLKANVQDYLQAADLFLFPSVHEGLGIVLVEAQCSGLPVVASTNVPKLAVMCEDIFKFVDLDSPISSWTDAIDSFKSQKRKSRKDELAKNGFDEESAKIIIENLYIEK